MFTHDLYGTQSLEVDGGPRQSVTGDRKGREAHDWLMPRKHGLRRQPGQVWQEADNLEVVCPAAGNPLVYYLQGGR